MLLGAAFAGFFVFIIIRSGREKRITVPAEPGTSDQENKISEDAEKSEEAILPVETFEKPFQELTDLTSSIMEGLEKLNTEMNSFEKYQFSFPENGDENIWESLKKNSGQIDQSIGKAFEMADNVCSEAKDAFDVSKKVQSGVQSIKNVLSESLKQTNALIKYSQNISKVIALMADISMRIHVLSINASIVSARAGKSGKEFDVIAKEIRTLAEGADKALEDISIFTREMQGTIESVVDITESAHHEALEEAEALNRVAGALQGVLLAVEVISTVTQSCKCKSTDLQDAIKNGYMMIEEYHEKLKGAEMSFIELKHVTEMIKNMKFTGIRLQSVMSDIAV